MNKNEKNSRPKTTEKALQLKCIEIADTIGQLSIEQEKASYIAEHLNSILEHNKNDCKTVMIAYNEILLLLDILFDYLIQIKVDINKADTNMDELRKDVELWEKIN